MTDKEKLKKVEDFVKEEFFHHASRDFFNQCCVSYNYTELTAFAQSIMELLQEEPVSEDLGKESFRFALKMNSLYSNDKSLSHIHFSGYDIGAAFQAGANWQKQQMMKDAVDGNIVNTQYPTQVQLNTYTQKFKDGDKVKLIIVKES